MTKAKSTGKAASKTAASSSKIVTAAPDTSIHARALLVWLQISTWTARKYDKKITEKVNHEYHASTDAGRYNKFLLPGDNDSYKSLIAIAGSIRAQHYAHTLAWSDEGWRLLPVDNYMTYTAWYRQQQREFSAALETFAAAYPAMRLAAQAKLNGLYRDEDYPTVQDMKTRFALAVEYNPVPASGDIRVQLASDQIDAIEQSINHRVASSVEIAVNDSWHRLHAVVAKIAERLASPDAIFRDTLISNAVDVCESLKRLNVTDDPSLEKMRVRVLDQLTRTSAETLRENGQVRKNTAAQAAEIMRSMSQFYSESK